MISKLLSKDTSGLHGAAFVLGVSSFASGLLGLLRDRIFAQTIGAGAELDVYYAAFRIPDFLFATIASFVSVTVLIPLLHEKMNSADKSRAAAFLSEVLTVFCAVMTVVSAVMFLAMPYLSRLVAPGFVGDAREMHILLSRILLLSPFFLGVSNLLGSVTQSLRRFAVYAISPIFYNAGIIVGALFFYPLWGLVGLVWGVVLGAFLHGAIQLPAVVRAGFTISLTSRIRWSEMRKVVALSIPRTIGLGASQLVIILLIALASQMPEGSISVFNFAYNMQSFALALVGVSYSVAVFPKLSEHMSRGERQEFSRHAHHAERQIAVWSLLGTAVGIFLAEPAVVFILGPSPYAQSIARVLSIFLLSVLAQGLVLLYTRSFYAAGETAKPVFANIFSALATIFLALFLVQLYGASVELLALAFSAGMLLNMLLQWALFRRAFSV